MESNNHKTYSFGSTVLQTQYKRIENLSHRIGRLAGDENYGSGNHAKLIRITDEEQKILQEQNGVDKSIYTEAKDFTVDSRKLLKKEN